MDTIRIEEDARGVARLVLARSEKHNALSAQMIAELTQAAAVLKDNRAVRVVVLCAEGPSFCAGGDLAWMKAQMTADAAARRDAALALARMLKALNHLPKPLIGAVQGNAFGGGLGMMAICDSVIVAEQAVFAFSEAKLGLIPATIGPYVVRRIGEGAARRYFFSSRMFDGREASALGLAATAVAAAQLEQAVEAEIAPYLECAPSAVAAAKAHLMTLAGPVSEAEIVSSAEALVAQWEQPEAMEGVTAFFERRRPAWR